jgi:hypothetical protein
VDKQDNIWVTDKGSEHGHQVQPSKGRVVMVFGRKLEAADEGTGPLKHPRSSAAAGGRTCSAR